MLLHKLSSNKSDFRPIEFKKGLNVILADRNMKSDEKDSRNGIGKSSILEIINFCLGSDFERTKTLKKPELKGWKFFLEATIRDSVVTISRSTNDPNRVYIEGSPSAWPVLPNSIDDGGMSFYSNEQWRLLLGKLIFGLPIESSDETYHPKFRPLISYFIRKGKDSYNDPFKHFNNQSPSQKQICNCFLLDLSWKLAKEWHLLKKEEDDLDNIKKSFKKSTLSGLIGTMGELKTTELQLKNQIEKRKEELKEFKVHPQYEEIENESNKLTKEIHNLSNKNISEKLAIHNYEKSITEENVADHEDICKLYEDLGLIFPKSMLKKIEEVFQFHEQVSKNRMEFLNQEIDRLKSDISFRNEKIEILSNKRKEKMDILQTHKALDEYIKLQERHSEDVAKLKSVIEKTSLLKRLEQGKSAMKIKRENLKIDTRRDIDERQDFYLKL